jgi:hypothetical protein
MSSKEYDMTDTNQEATRERAPAERKTLEDALNIATSIVDAEAGRERAPMGTAEQYTLAAGFLVLCGDMAAMLDASKKASNYCGWCERANENSRIDRVPMTLDEVREHTVKCRHNPVVAEVERLRSEIRAAQLAPVHIEPGNTMRAWEAYREMRDDRDAGWKAAKERDGEATALIAALSAMTAARDEAVELTVGLCRALVTDVHDDRIAALRKVGGV